MIQDIKDRLPTKPNTWEVTHSDSTVEEVTVARADEPTEVGTPINSALFKNLQGDVYTGVQYNTPTYSGNDMVLSLPLTSYETGKIVNIISPATFSTNPTLNINGLGAKTVNALLTLNQKYTLIYNGSSFDVMANVGTNKYYPITRGSPTSITNENIIPTTGWREINPNSFTTQGIKITASSTMQGSSVLNAIDGNNVTYWNSNTNSDNITIEFPLPIQINKLRTRITADTASAFSGATITGSNNGTTWTTLYTLSTYQSALTELTLNNTAEYKYYRVSISATGSSRRCVVYGLEVTDYTSYTYTVDYPVNSYSDIWGINVIPSATSWKSKLLVSGLGVAKDVNGALIGGEKYTLIYNGTSFDITKADYSDIEQGTDDFKYITPYLANILAKSIVVNGVLSTTSASYASVNFGADVKAVIVQLADYGTPPYVLFKGLSSTITIETNATISSFSSEGVLQYMSRTKNVNYIALY